VSGCPYAAPPPITCSSNSPIIWILHISTQLVGGALAALILTMLSFFSNCRQWCFTMRADRPLEPLTLCSDRLRNGELLCDLLLILEPATCSHLELAGTSATLIASLWMFFFIFHSGLRRKSIIWICFPHIFHERSKSLCLNILVASLTAIAAISSWTLQASCIAGLIQCPKQWR
jgi:hypothetical protein